MDTYMLEKIYDIFCIPIYIIKDGEESISFPPKEIYQSPFERDHSLSNDILARAKSKSEPFLYLENENIYYGAFKDKEDYVYLFGPMARKSMSGSAVEAYRHAHRIQLRFLIEKCGFGISSRMLALAYYHRIPTNGQRDLCYDRAKVPIICTSLHSTVKRRWADKIGRIEAQNINNKIKSD